MSAPAPELREGLRVGFWTLLRQLPREKYRSRWLCRCVCGTERPVLAQKLRNKNRAIASCGCRLQARRAQIRASRAAALDRLITTRRDAVELLRRALVCIDQRKFPGTYGDIETYLRVFDENQVAPAEGKAA